MKATENWTRAPAMRWARMRPRARALTVLAAVTAVTLVVATAMARSRRSRDAEREGNASGGTMSGMPGMAMGSKGTVRLTAAQIGQFGVTFGTVEVRPLVAETRTTGTITFDETKIAQVVPKFAGYVERLYVNATGQPVRLGQPLLDVYSADLVAAQQELLLAGNLQRDLGRSAVPGVPAATTDLVEAAKRRLRLWDISDTQIDEVLRTGRVRRTLTLYSPAAGVVTEKHVVQGQAIQAGDQLYTIADLSDVWVDVQLRELDAAAVRTGSGADIEVAGLAGRTFKGRVAYVYPTLDSVSRAIRARVVVANTANVLKPGMYATVHLTTPSRSALTVANSAILRTGERNVVFVDMGNGELMPHGVELGRTAGEYTEVLAGLEPGQRVVTSAQFLLDSESNLGEVMRAMMGQMSSADANKMQDMKDMPGMEMPGMNDRGADVRGVKSWQTVPGPKSPSPATPRR